MGSIKPDELKKSDIHKLEAEIHNLWSELNAINLPFNQREELKSRLTQAADMFQDICEGKGAVGQLIEVEKALGEIDYDLAHEAVRHAEDEVPRKNHSKTTFQALENVRKELESGAITPIKARHAVKEIMRSH